MNKRFNSKIFLNKYKMHYMKKNAMKMINPKTAFIINDLMDQMKQAQYMIMLSENRNQILNGQNVKIRNENHKVNYAAEVLIQNFNAGNLPMSPKRFIGVLVNEVIKNKKPADEVIRDIMMN